ncbi:MAG TPA: phenylalanine--tRNA ligase subunit beta [Egibacteraceae bacterium]|nr:phenylalanine--tRNA ligase subunit beta [Egibacteraceae bacterium]
MRVPLSWLSDFVDITLSAEDLAETLTVGGLQVEAIERPSAGARGVAVAEVRSVEKVAGSDKLHLVEAFDGTDTLEVVCGAANYGPGDRVAWAKPGATLPGGVEIGRRQLFGVTSNGMLASPRELGVGDDHRGIWVLERDAPLGADVAEWLGLDDAVLVLEVTPDRGYALSLHGLARDLAALTGADLHLPALPSERPAGAGPPPHPVPVTIADPDRCRRFDARTIGGVEPGPSPAWLQRRLAAAGMRPVSNLVDATNAVMLETGNPTHAYDLALLAGPAIEVRTARAGERLRTLDGVDRDLDADDLLICDADGPIALAGVMGGEATEINPATRDVLVEVANFDACSVLRTARRHGLHTEGSRRWEKTVPPESVPVAADRCVELVTATAGGGVGAQADHYPNPPERPVIRLRPPRACAHLGVDLTAADQAALLEAIDCAVTPAGVDLDVTPPAYRPDLRLEADLYEEIARLHGYGRVPERVPSTGQVGRRTPEHDARRALRGALAGGGWTEVMPFPFIADADIDSLALDPDDRRRRTIALVNPLSKEESVLRTTLLPGLLRVVRHNVNRQTPDVAVFEVGHVFLEPTPEQPGADGGPDGTVLPAEPIMLGLAACGAFVPARHDRPARDADLFDLLGAVELVLRTLGRSGLDATRTAEPPFHPGRAARLRVGGRDVGVAGELHPRVAAAFEVPPRTLVAELDLAPILAGGVRPRHAVVPSPLPGLRFDVAVVVDEDTSAAAVEAAVRAGAGARVTAVTLFDVYRGAQLGEGRKSLAYTVLLDDPERQLTDTDEAQAIDAIARAVGDAVGGTLRR